MLKPKAMLQIPPSQNPSPLDDSAIGQYVTHAALTMPADWSPTIQAPITGWRPSKAGSGARSGRRSLRRRAADEVLAEFLAREP